MKCLLRVVLASIVFLLVFSLSFFLLQSEPYGLLRSPEIVNKNVRVKGLVIDRIIDTEVLEPINDLAFVPDISSDAHFVVSETYNVEDVLRPSRTPEISHIRGTKNAKDFGEMYDNPECKSSYIKNMDPLELVDYLKTHDRQYCLKYMWNYDDNLQSVLSEQHFLAVLTEIESQAPFYAGTNENNLNELIFFVRIMHYHRFYYPQQLPLNETAITYNVQVFNILAQNPHLNDLNNEAADILYDYINSIDAAFLLHEYVNVMDFVLEDFLNDPARARDYGQRINVYSLFFSLNRNVLYSPYNQILIDRINQELIDKIKDVAFYSELYPTNNWLINNAIWSLGVITSTPQHNLAGIISLTEILDYYPYLSEPYLWVVKAIDYFNDCQTARPGEKICVEDIFDEVFNLAFPYTFSFDDGRMIFRTAVDLNTIQTLYHAVKEVESQFKRVAETLKPVPGDPNEVLQIMIYGSMADYEVYHPFLFGLNTNNGGIYIEQWGQIFTYQRENYESIYTLEELIRHEYTHYLVGRYMIEGMWGEVPIYENNRFVWFDEGFAEFFTGSKPDKGVKPRKKLVERIKMDGENRMAVKEIVRATYSDFYFYRYASLLFNYLYENDIPTLRSLVRAVKENEIQKFDNIVAQMSANSQLESDYQNYLDQQINILESLQDPVTIFPDLSKLDTPFPLNIQRQFRTTRMGYRADCTQVVSLLNSRFGCSKVLTGNVVPEPNYDQAWLNFNSNLDEMINELRQRDYYNNFKGMNCMMGEIRYVEYYGQGVYPIADYYCEGPLKKVFYVFPFSKDESWTGIET